MTPQWVYSENENYSKESAGFLNSAQSRSPWFKLQFRVVKVNRLAQIAVIGQISQENDASDTQWVHSKNENYSKKSGWILGSAQTRLLWFKRQFRVAKVNKLAQNAVFWSN